MECRVWKIEIYVTLFQQTFSNKKIVHKMNDYNFLQKMSPFNVGPHNYLTNKIFAGNFF